MKNDETILRPKILAEIAIFASLSAVLYAVRPFSLPYGGAVTLGSMAPVMWLSLRRGMRVGFIAGAIFGGLALLVDVLLLPYSPIANPVQVFLEYPIAFGVLALAGFAHRKTTPVVIVGVFLSGSLKFLIHFLAGVFFWQYVAGAFPPGWNPAWYSAVYNGSFIIPEFAVSGIILVILVKRKTLEYSL